MFYHREYGCYFSTPQEVTAYLKEKKISEQTDKERENLFYQIKETMNGIYKQGGRNTESDLFGENGKYVNSPTKSEQETEWY